jgi:hypothetical protein
MLALPFATGCGDADNGGGPPDDTAKQDNAATPTRPAWPEPEPRPAAPPLPPAERKATVTAPADKTLEAALAPLRKALLGGKAITIGERTLRPEDTPSATIEALSMAFTAEGPMQRKRLVLGPVSIDLNANPLDSNQYMFSLESNDPVWSNVAAAGVIDLSEETIDVSSVRGEFELSRALLNTVPRWGPTVWSRFRPSGSVTASGNAFWDAADIPKSQYWFGFGVRNLGFDLLPGLRATVDAEALRLKESTKGKPADDDTPGGIHALVEVKYVWNYDQVDEEGFLKRELYCGDLAARFAGGLLLGFVKLPLTDGEPYFGNAELVGCDAAPVLSRILPRSQRVTGELAGEFVYRGLLGVADSLELTDGRATLARADLTGNAVYRAMTETRGFDLPADPAPETTTIEIFFEYNRMQIPEQTFLLPEEALTKGYPRNANLTMKEIRLTVDDRTWLGAGHVTPDRQVHLVLAPTDDSGAITGRDRLLVKGPLDGPEAKRIGVGDRDDSPPAFRTLMER